MESKDLLLAHMDDLAARAVKTGCAVSRFLTPAQAQSVSMHFMRTQDVTLILDGGYEGAERVRAVFLHPDWGSYDRDELFAALKIGHRPQDALGHRDILGALMALGIERDVLGDITAQPFAALLCLPEFSAYVTENLTQAGRVGLRVSAIALQAFPVKTESLAVKKDTVASLRLDAVLCVAFGLSRAKAAELITAGRVSLCHVPCLQPAKELSQGDLLSVRGLGRAKLLETGGLSRKGRIFIHVGVYGQA